MNGEEATCPRWCAGHLNGEDGRLISHLRDIQRGDVKVTLEAGPDGDPHVYVGGIGQPAGGGDIYGHDISCLAECLWEAARLTAR